MTRQSSTPSRPTVALITALLSGAGLTLAIGQQADAAIFYETDAQADVGKLLSNAALVTAGNSREPLTGIIGTLNSGADLFKLTIRNSAGDFLASTENTRPANQFGNTQLFLFNEEGYGIFANDNTPPNDPARANPGSTRSTIRIRQGTLPDGIYYLGISGFDYDPVDANNNFIFIDGREFRDNRVGPWPGAGPLANWVGHPGYQGPTETYHIDLVGADYLSLLSPIPPGGGSTPPSPSPSPSPSASPSPISSVSPSPSVSPSLSPSPSPSVSPSVSPSLSPSPSPSVSPSVSPSLSPSPSPSVSPSVSPSPSPSVSPSVGVNPTPPYPGPYPGEGGHNPGSGGNPVAVPEPTTMSGLAIAAGFGWLMKRRQKGDRPT